MKKEGKRGKIVNLRVESEKRLRADHFPWTSPVIRFDAYRRTSRTDINRYRLFWNSPFRIKEGAISRKQ